MLFLSYVCLVLSCTVSSRLVLSCLASSHLVLSCLVLSCPVMSLYFLTLSFLVVCLVLSCLVLKFRVALCCAIVRYVCGVVLRCHAPVPPLSQLFKKKTGVAKQHRAPLLHLRNVRHLNSSSDSKKTGVPFILFSLDNLKARKKKHNKIRQHNTTQHKTRQGKARQDKTKNKTRQDKTGPDMMRQGKARQDKTRHNMTREDHARPGKTESRPVTSDVKGSLTFLSTLSTFTLR